MSPQEIITQLKGITPAVVSATAASLAFIFSIYNFIATRKTAKRLKDFDHKSAIIKQRQDMYKDIRTWSNEVIQTLAEAATLCHFEPIKTKDFYERYHKIYTNLSSLLDKGRLLLPNNTNNSVGTHKEGAFKGLRQAATNILADGVELAAKYDYVNKEFNMKNLEANFIKCRRDFVSEIQQIIEVRQLEKEVRELIRALDKEIKK